MMIFSLLDFKSTFSKAAPCPTAPAAATYYVYFEHDDDDDQNNDCSCY